MVKICPFLKEKPPSQFEKQIPVYPTFPVCTIGLVSNKKCSLSLIVLNGGLVITDHKETKQRYILYICNSGNFLGPSLQLQPHYLWGRHSTNYLVAPFQVILNTFLSKLFSSHNLKKNTWIQLVGCSSGQSRNHS